MAIVPRGERLVIAITGKRNAGKSSLINALTGQEIAIVSEVAGTTTDPVAKHYELIPIGPVTFFDTAGIDDVGELGQKRIRATRQILYRADIAILVIGTKEINATEKKLIHEILELKIPLLIVFNKSDLYKPATESLDFIRKYNINYCTVSAATGDGIEQCKDLIKSLTPHLLIQERPLVGDLIKSGNHIILVTPIDTSAPKGRMILPQMQVLRDLLDYNAVVTFTREMELKIALESLKNPPDLVITDSQAIQLVAEIIPDAVLLTTFSILFARYKGELQTLLNGARKIDELKDGDKILIAESCSHHVQCDDIGRFKLPNWLNQFTQKKLIYEVFAGHDFPDNLEEFALAIHCGACMINPMEMTRRIHECERRGVPITNYGMTISKVQGLLERVVRVFGI
ncbi:MAG: [FeFe] hydrogenase H-cluster maturation GTPase HydF [Candidatus Cloacimonadaceae bacterium]